VLQVSLLGPDVWRVVLSYLAIRRFLGSGSRYRADGVCIASECDDRSTGAMIPLTLWGKIVAGTTAPVGNAAVLAALYAAGSNLFMAHRAKWWSMFHARKFNSER
jgi:hypothetical protein